MKSNKPALMERASFKSIVSSLLAILMGLVVGFIIILIANPSDVSDDALDYIATHFEDNIRELEGALRRFVYYCASFKADVANDGARGEYEIEWLDDGVQIILSGEEQPTAYYILPYKTLEEN